VTGNEIGLGEAQPGEVDEAVSRGDEEGQVVQAVRVDAPDDRAEDLHAGCSHDDQQRAHAAFRRQATKGCEENRPGSGAEEQLTAQAYGHVDPEDGEEERDDEGAEEPGARSHHGRQNTRVRRYDAIVVGAGPAGSTAAYRLAAAGADVLLLDRAKFPRDKPCGGGVTERAARLLPFSLDTVVEDVATRVDLRLRYGRTIERGAAAPLVYMTQRKRLDHFLAEQATAAGADFRDGVRVTAVESSDGGVGVTGNGERYEADALIGADGVNGLTARALDLGGNQSVGVALEGNLPHDRFDGERYRGRLVLEFGVVAGGYAWVFPKGDHANFGVGGWGSEGPALRDHLCRLCEAHDVSADDLEDVRGYRLPLRSARSTLARGRALLVGDAAGLIDPVSGDGMFEGFLSSQYAAEATRDLLAGRAQTLEPYGPRLAARLATHLWASWGAKVALDRFPRTMFGLASTRVVWSAVERIVRGDVTDVGAVHGLARPPLKAVKLLVRAAGDPGRAYRGA
jgi:geranylgeranyl reductase family protein